MIKVKRNSDNKVFTTDMSKSDCIYEIHFCISYTQVMIQERDSNGKINHGEIICEAVGTDPNWVDSIATYNDEFGSFI